MIKHRKALKPIPCDTCGEIIAAGEEYFRQTAFEPAKKYCDTCFNSGASDYLMWVGSSFYPTIEAFVGEADKVGVCKRVPKVPSDMKPGVSRVFLVHDEGKRPTDEEKEQGTVSCGQVFGFFPIMAIRLILDDKDAIKKYRDQLKGVTLDIIGTKQAAKIESRGCGDLVEGAVYLVSSPTMDQIWSMAEDLTGRMELKGGIVLFKEFVDASHIARFRGIKHMEPGLIPPLDNLGISLGRFQINKIIREVAPGVT